MMHFKTPTRFPICINTNIRLNICVLIEKDLMPIFNRFCQITNDDLSMQRIQFNQNVKIAFSLIFRKSLKMISLKFKHSFEFPFKLHSTFMSKHSFIFANKTLSINLMNVFWLKSNDCLFPSIFEKIVEQIIINASVFTSMREKKYILSSFVNTFVA